LGGSFNPPHAGHRAISQAALKQLGLDRLWWLVTPGNPLKPQAGLLPLRERLALSRTMAADPRIIVTGFEKNLGSAHTVSTLSFLRRRFPDTHFVWLMGADCLSQFHHWVRWREIFQMLPIAVIDRPGWRLRALSSKAAQTFEHARLPEAQAHRLAVKPPPAWAFLTVPLSNISSTAIRAGRVSPVAETPLFARGRATSASPAKD
jgi:nicotinate-nucleotide adenylyltransferase